jgi:hypothetical protein
VRGGVRGGAVYFSSNNINPSSHPDREKQFLK